MDVELQRMQDEGDAYVWTLEALEGIKQRGNLKEMYSIPPHTPEWAIDWFAHTRFPDLKDSAAAHPNTSEATLLYLAKSKSWHLLSRLSRRKHPVPDRVVRAFFNNPENSWANKTELANSSKACSPEVIEELAKVPENHRLVAGSPLLSVDTIRRIAEQMTSDTVGKVVFALARNPNLPTDVIDLLLREARSSSFYRALLPRKGLTESQVQHLLDLGLAEVDALLVSSRVLPQEERAARFEAMLTRMGLPEEEWDYHGLYQQVVSAQGFGGKNALVTLGAEENGVHGTKTYALDGRIAPSFRSIYGDSRSHR